MKVDMTPNYPRPKRSRWLRRGVYAIVAVACLLAFIAASNKGRPPAGSRLPQWHEFEGNPVIESGQQVDHMIWNDPSVLKDNGMYRMWFSGGDPRNPKHIVVRVYYAESKDGVRWTVNPNPVLGESSDPNAFDGLRTETPSVIKVGNTYHMYYGGFNEESFNEKSDHIGRSEIGHATSTDGVHWTKDPANPVVVGQEEDRSKWGYGGVGEPGAVYNPKDKLIYLYYTGMHFPEGRKNIGQGGVLLATSKDGSKFNYYGDKSGRKVVFTRDIPEAPPGAWFAYSTPAALITSDGKFRLFVDLLIAPKGPTTARQVTLVEAVSNDGMNFDTAEENILEANKGDWKDWQVRSPTVVQEPDGSLKMWFAAETRKPHYLSGIGLITRERP